ncbi:transcriptional regulator, TetR family [Microbacterium sp. cf046]|uniref:TetR/AcrR family transcriptional regulator n=1 Tax=Microbacterium sp. cf046 TaxID=1761803 RepID=UPI0008F266EB|nr:TetR/AcrR family transcriptional regulator [Microbacterium sp. cf046]SFS16826.1 transcriptional regulator, TetR family [Microbacterium sp. cf046]
MTADTAPAAAGPVGKPRGRYAKTEATRAAIIDAALEVFADGGFRSGSLRDVAIKVGLTEPALLHHFGTKSGLLEAVLVYRDKQSYDLAPLDRMIGEESIRGLIALVRFNASQPGVIELYTTLAAEATSEDHPVHAYFVRRYETVRSILGLALQQLDAEGKLADGVTPEWAADATMALMDGLQVQWLLDRTVLDMAERLRVFLRLITRLDL